MPDFTNDARTVDLACPICDDGGERRVVATTVWGAPDAIVCRCTACGIVFLDPIMTDDEEASFYKAEFAHYMRERGGPGETKPADHFAKNQLEAERRIHNLLPYLKPTMRALEIGSSTGFVLEAVSPHVASVAGVEPGELYAQYANSRGLQTHPSLSALSGERFDLILAYYVVEHLQKPLDRLRDLRDMLSPGGIIALEVPNVDDALVKLYQLSSFDEFYWQKAHYFYYSHQTMTTVLAKAGFETIRVLPEQRYDISNHIHWLLKGEPGGKGKYTHVFDDRLNDEYGRCLREHWLCDTVYAVAAAPG